MEGAPWLVERDSELSALDALLEQACVGAGGALIVAGAAGIGKTTLLERTIENARTGGLTVLTARSSELEATFAFGVVRQLLERYVRALDSAERADLLSGTASLAAFLLDPGSAARGPSDDDASFGVLHGLYWLVAGLAARGPVLIAVDDLQWCDAASMRFLAYTARRLEGLPVALAGTLRAKARATDERALGELCVAAAGEPLTPTLLSPAGVELVVRAAFAEDPSGAFSRACHEATGGNPFYLRELLRTGIGPTEHDVAAIASVGAAGVAEYVLRRTALAGSDATAVAEAVAVLGDHDDVGRIARLTRQDQSAVADGIRALVDAEVLAGEHPPTFIHPLVQAAVYEALTVARRDRLHRAAAEVLAEEGAASDAVAAHLERCRPAGDAWALERLTAAAADALARGAPESAVAFLRRALAEPPSLEARAGILRRLANTENLLNDPRAIGHLEEAWETVPDGRERAEVALELGGVLAWAQRGVEAVGALYRGLQTLGSADATLAQRLDSQIIAEGMTHHETRSLALERLARYDDEVPDGPAAAAVLTARALGSFLYGGTAAATAALAEQALAQSNVTSAGSDSETQALGWWILIYAERPAEAERILLAERELAWKAGRLRDIANVEVMLGFAALRRGNLPEAMSRAQAELALNDVSATEFAASIVAQVATEWGDFEEAARTLNSLPARTWTPEAKGAFLAYEARWRLNLARGRLGEARTDCESEGERVRASGISGPAGLGWRLGLAIVSAREGDLEAARAFAEEELEEARTWDGSRAIGCALLTLGLVIGGKEGIDRLDEAVAVLDGSYAKLEHARALVELGAALRRDNRRSIARQPLADGLDLAFRCGARALVRRATEELRAAGARPRRILRAGVEALTPSELRVARMAAAGASNREIAQELYITPKTVEGHLGHIYLKVGLSGREARRDLASVLAGEIAA